MNGNEKVYLVTVGLLGIWGGYEGGEEEGKKGGGVFWLKKALAMNCIILFRFVQMGACLTEPHHNRSDNRQTEKTASSNPSKNQPPPRSQPAQPLQIPKAILRPQLPKQLPQPSSNPTLKSQIKPVSNEFIEVKVPKDYSQWTDFQWLKEPLYFIPEAISASPASSMKTRSFQQKLKWFQVNLEKLRISWTNTKSEYLQVDRENILMSSRNQFQKIDFHKEVKVAFKDEKETTDAGGLLREWMNLCIKQIFNPDLGLLKLCDTPATFYKFNYNQNVADLFEVASTILGIVIGKAVFERIPLECPLNYTILRQLCSQPIQMNDVYTYDRDFYNGWNFVINNNSMTTMMQQNFCVYEFDEHGTQITVPLKENGFDIMVNSNNKDEYVTLMIEHYCTKSIDKLLQNLKYGLNKIIPANLLEVFLPHELDIIVNGRQVIDAKDLKENTIYTNCAPSDPIIVWFWQFVGGLNQQKLSHLLHFVTGNGRVPILGFKYLESNRGQFQRFHIKMVDYDAIDPYPKSHTCFNRLELPLYPNIATFRKYIEYVTVEMIHFGLS